MKVAILGTGDVGKALGRGFIALGHEVRMGSRSADHEGMSAWVKECGARASGGTFADAAKFAEVIVLATLGSANEAALLAAGRENLRGKLLIETTNPLDMSSFPPGLSISGNDSGGEHVQRLVPEARVVKAFNTVGNAHMFKPSFPGGTPDMFIAGNDDAAKKQVAGILTDFGWGTVDIGGIEGSRYLEAMCMVWVAVGARGGGWNHAFKLLRK